MYPSIFQILIIFFTFLSTGLNANEPGSLIILYGTPCSGKSTLSKLLVDSFPGKFKIVKKDAVVQREREALIERATGIRVQGDLKALEEILDNLGELKEEIKQIHSDATVEVLRSIKTQVEMGENIIFDVCIRDTFPIETISGIRTLAVMVYAPLSVLSQRSSKRAEVNRYSKDFEARRWRNILAAFRHLFRESTAQDSDFLATASKRELNDLFQKYSFSQEIRKLQTENRRAVKAFGLDMKNWVSLSPKFTPDLFINTGLSTQEESLSKIVNAFEAMVNTQSQNDTKALSLNPSVHQFALLQPR